MILAATKGGIHDVDSGDVMLGDRDVACVAQRDDKQWAFADHGRTVLFRSGDGHWAVVANVDGDAGTVLHPLGGGRALVGTVGAHLLRVEDGELQSLESFDTVPGRATWENPAASGRPDVWSFASDGDAVFTSVHVGGLWRSDDGGEGWVNVLEPDVDVHQVVSADGVVAVAAQRGFGMSRDHGESWSWTTGGLHADYLQSIALTDDSVFVGVSSGPFAHDAAVYRASPPGAGFERRSAGLPAPFDPIGPYHLVADRDRVALAAWNSQTLFVSDDAGVSWRETSTELPKIRSLAVA